MHPAWPMHQATDGVVLLVESEPTGVTTSDGWREVGPGAYEKTIDPSDPGGSDGVH